MTVVINIGNAICI